MCANLANDLLTKNIVVFQPLIRLSQENDFSESVNFCRIKRFHLPRLRQIFRLNRAIAGSLVTVCAHDEDDFLAFGAPAGDCSPRSRFRVIRMRGYDQY